ncbi:MAG TPA: TetR/AcrR family transcriptional regulator [Mycobacteriales bacterium]|nr:TetR/AcrR family transcriptional regulator [Mycobacteriales bacterium]
MSSEKPAKPAKRSAVSRRELAVARVLDPARERAETRVQAFLDAAMELMNGSAGQEFTVQEVIERSGQSLRSFYQYFDGKYELLLALFEDSVRTVAAQLQEDVAAEPTALDRLHRFVVEYFHQCQPASKGRTTKRGFAPAFASFSHQLLTEHPVEASRAFVPLATMLEGLLVAASDEGAIRSGLDQVRLAGTILQSIMFNAFAATISGVSAHPADVDPAEELWDLLINGMGK